MTVWAVSPKKGTNILHAKRQSCDSVRACVLYNKFLRRRGSTTKNTQVSQSKYSFWTNFHRKVPAFKIAMSWLVRRPSFTFWLTFFQGNMLPLFFCGKKKSIMSFGIFLVLNKIRIFKYSWVVHTLLGKHFIQQKTQFPCVEISMCRVTNCTGFMLFTVQTTTTRNIFEKDKWREIADVLTLWLLFQYYSWGSQNKVPLRKHTYSNILKILPPKKWKFSDKKFWYFSDFCSKHRLWALVRTASTRRF